MLRYIEKAFLRRIDIHFFSLWFKKCNCKYCVFYFVFCNFRDSHEFKYDVSLLDYIIL